MTQIKQIFADKNHFESYKSVLSAFHYAFYKKHNKMKKWFIFLVFLLLLVSSCAGTKYKNQANNTTKTYKSEIKEKQDSSQEEYVEYTEDFYFDLDFDLPKPADSSVPVGLADYIIKSASENLGVRYRAGGTTKSGFDCSGLVYTSFKKSDISLPRSSYDMAQYGQKIKDSEAQKGDLIFFITNGGKRINDVGIVTEVLDNEIKFIHSSVQLGVIISSTKEPYYKKNFVKVHRVL